MKEKKEIDFGEVNLSTFSRSDAVQKYSESQRLRRNERFLIERYFNKRGGKIFVLGCGAGRTIIALIKMGFEVDGADFSLSMVSAARKNVSAAGFRANVFEADASRLFDLSPEVYDYVFFPFNGIDYVWPEERREKVYDGVRRILKPGGIFIFSTHNFYFFKFFLKFMFFPHSSMYLRELPPHGGELWVYHSKAKKEKEKLGKYFTRIHSYGSSLKMFLLPIFDKALFYVAIK